MKSIYSIMLLMATAFQCLAQWVPQNSGTTGFLESVHFPTATTGYAIDQFGSGVLKTTNSGNTWTQVGNELLVGTKVLFTSQNVGFVTGVYLYKTTDGGTNWAVSLQETNLNAIFFLNENTGYVAGFGGKMFKTTNGGSTWTALNTGITEQINSIDFPTSSTGFAVGNNYTLIQTTDGGTSWNSLMSGSGFNFNSVEFINANTGFAAGSSIYKFCHMIKTNNGGSTWTNVFPDDFNFDFYSVQFPMPSTGYAVGYGIIGFTPFYIMKTTDGGTNWTPQLNALQGGTMKSVWFSIADVGHVVGWQGMIYYTTNGGIGVGVDENSYNSERLKLYPNPVADFVTIEKVIHNEGSVSVQFFSPDGREIYKKELLTEKMKVDVARFSRGIYLVQLTDEKGAVVRKILKQ